MMKNKKNSRNVKYYIPAVFFDKIILNYGKTAKNCRYKLYYWLKDRRALLIKNKHFKRTSQEAIFACLTMEWTNTFYLSVFHFLDRVAVLLHRELFSCRE